MRGLFYLPHFCPQFICIIAYYENFKTLFYP